MKIKGPSVPPPPTPVAADPSKTAELQSKSKEVVNVLAGLMGAQEEVQKKERKERLTESEKRKKLKAFGAKCGVKQGDSSRQATQKIVHSVLGEEYDSKERGFKNMVEEITSFIQEENSELKEKFDQWISTMLSEET